MKKRSGVVVIGVMCCMMSLHAVGDDSSNDNFGGKVDISEFNLAEVVQALFNKAEYFGRKSKEALTVEEACAELEKTGCSLRMIKGCYVPIDIVAGEKTGSRQIDTHLFNAWNGALAAERTIEALRDRQEKQ